MPTTPPTQPTKIAIFVEGLTELEFLKSLINEIATTKNVSLEIHAQHKGVLHLVTKQQAPKPEVHFLLANCCNDDQVKTLIIDNYSGLVSQGYSQIIGIRDVFPLSHADIPKLVKHAKTGLPTTPISPEIYLAVMEIESWFIEEHTHFKRIDIQLSEEKIEAAGFDKNTISAEQLANPALTLHQIYQTVGKAYKKSSKHIQRTVQALDYSELRTSTRTRSTSLNSALNAIEKHLC